MADGFELLRARLGGAQHLVCLFEAALFHQSPSEDELGWCDIEQEILPALEEIQRVPRFLLGGLHLTGHEVHVRE